VITAAVLAACIDAARRRRSAQGKSLPHDA
jgi:hypothetical protein